MKKITIQTNYQTQWGQSLHISGSTENLGDWDINRSVKMNCSHQNNWTAEVEIDEQVQVIEFKFYVLDDSRIVDQEKGCNHIIVPHQANTVMNCYWHDTPKQRYFQTSVFQNSIFKHQSIDVAKIENKIAFMVTCFHVEQHQELIIVGSSLALGRWDTLLGQVLTPIGYGKWLITFDEEDIKESTYKLAIRQKETKKLIEWEEGDNRYFAHKLYEGTYIEEIAYQKNCITWKASGVAIPMFSLRSQKSFGIGEFSDLKLLIDWGVQAKLKIIQILPINDTTATYSWIDSYPYNAISTYALHPIYLGLQQFPLQDDAKYKKYLVEASILNLLQTVDYTSVIDLKSRYITDLYNEIGEATLSSEDYRQFYEQNNAWLKPYAYFSYLRDRYQTAQISQWGEFSSYNPDRLSKLEKEDQNVAYLSQKVYFTQFLLHKQLLEAKEYAHKNGVVLKGDIPIGISPNSVEAWTEPHLFNLDSQTGAPPDDFSINGQNWGFPTYNWREMQKDGYKWWAKRFIKMGDYFDAYRIDHILGFFRIWEIPKTSVHGLLGYFSPAKPLSTEEIKRSGFPFDEDFTIASIHQDDIPNLLGENWYNEKNYYLHSDDGIWYKLKEDFNNQRKIQQLFATCSAPKDIALRDALYALCNEVLFIRDKYESANFHPRISLQSTARYKRLTDEAKHAINELYDDFFYHRHTQFWRDEAMSKLPSLIDATNMLVCGEDLGMVPESVPSVMNDLQILSLEIQRMPKQLGAQFGDMRYLPYLSVTTTSTHDMAPLRLWWKDDYDRTQRYYATTLDGKGEAPRECNTAIALQIIESHLSSPAMLTILPLQDWLAISDKLKRKNAEEEQINDPSNSRHNWNYRMHITLEELVAEKDFSKLIFFLNEKNER